MLYLPQTRQPTWKSGFARSAAESAHPGLWKNLLFAGSFGLGPTGDNLFDVSGRGYIGARSGSGTTPWEVRDGKYCGDFDGSDDIVNVSPNIPFASGEHFTLASWVRSGNIASRFAISVGAGASNQGPHLGHTLTNWRFAIFGDGVVDNSTDLETNVWHHLLGTYDGTNGRLYLDGRQIGSTTAFTFTGTDGSVRLGRGNSGGFWVGQLDDVFLWNRALSAAEDLQLVTLGRGGIFQRKPIVLGKATAAPTDGVARLIFLTGEDT